MPVPPSITTTTALQAIPIGTDRAARWRGARQSSALLAPIDTVIQGVVILLQRAATTNPWITQKQGLGTPDVQNLQTFVPVVLTWNGVQVQGLRSRLFQILQS